MNVGALDVNCGVSWSKLLLLLQYRVKGGKSTSDESRDLVQGHRLS